MFSRSSGRSALSPDEESLVVSNLYDGVDWYSMKDRRLTQSATFRIDADLNVILPILFINNWSAVLLGSSCGHARIFDAQTTETIQTLDHNGAYFLCLHLCYLNAFSSWGYRSVAGRFKSFLFPKFTSAIFVRHTMILKEPDGSPLLCPRRGKTLL